jgi:hypothetical protein
MSRLSFLIFVIPRRLQPTQDPLFRGLFRPRNNPRLDSTLRVFGI